MKKIITLILVMCVSITLSQKKLIIYNYMADRTVTLNNILTKPMDTNVLAYPYYYVQPQIVIPNAGGSYTLVNPNSLVKFPLYTPTSNPFISSWFKISSASVSVNQTALNAWNTMSNKQSFHCVKFAVNNANGVLGGSAVVGVSPFGVSNVKGAFNCIYEEIYPIAGNLNLIEYTIVIFD